MFILHNIMHIVHKTLTFEHKTETNESSAELGFLLLDYKVILAATFSDGNQCIWVLSSNVDD